MTTVEEIVAFLADAVQRPEHLVDDVQRFQHAVWEAPDRSASDTPREWAVLDELAYELANFVADSEVRDTDPAYYGRERALRTISSGLERLVGLRRGA